MGRGASISLGARRDGGINAWPGMLDLVTSTLMVFLLIGFLQTALDPEDLEALITRAEQNRFLAVFTREFAEELQAGTMSVERGLNLVQITFSDRILFASAEHHLEPEGRRLLERCALVLEKAQGTGFEQIQVEGHTDTMLLDREIYPRNNWELSAARALSVVSALAGRPALPQRLFSANGYSEHRPVASNRTVRGRARNRRIELRLFFSVTGGGPSE